jgi:hypothetical protein
MWISGSNLSTVGIAEKALPYSPVSPKVQVELEAAECPQLLLVIHIQCLSTSLVHA